MDRRLVKEKLGLPESEALIHYQESQFIACIKVETSSSISKSNEQRAAPVTVAPRSSMALEQKFCKTYIFSVISEAGVEI